MELKRKPLWKIYLGRFKHWIATIKYKMSKKDYMGY
jgi:hypothetical protein